MKRKQESPSNAPSPSKKKKCATRWTPKKQRSGGVVTVEAASSSSASSSSAAFKRRDTTTPSPAPPPHATPTPRLPPPPSPPALTSSTLLPPPPPLLRDRPSDFLVDLRRFAFKALIDSAVIPKLLDCVTRKFLLTPTSESWGEECEAVFTLLYVTLHYPSSITAQFAEEVATEFMGRWIADTGTGSLRDLDILITEKKKNASFTLLLLCTANHLPEKVEKSQIEGCLSGSDEWSSDFGVPQWLIDVLGPTENMSSLKRMLFASYMMLEGLPFSLQVQNGYVGVVVQYLSACKLYKESDYNGALVLLNEVDLEKSGKSLQAWVSWLIGLSLFKLGKPHTALVKLQDAVEKCDTAVPAIFNISQVFRKKDLPSAEVETLSLLCRMYEESCSSIAVVLQNLQDTPVCPSVGHRTLFCMEDDLPSLPTYENAVILQAIATFQRGNFEIVLTTLDQIDVHGDYFTFYKESNEKKMECICRAVCRLMKSEALRNLDKTDDSLRECSRLEGDLSWVAASFSTESEICIFILKTLVYSLLSLLHELKKNTKSQSHYKRLAVQNMKIFPETIDLPLWEEFSMSDRLIMENIYCFLDEKFKSSSLHTSC
ncbi:uncharacterized protein [Palaemon carinicauda]|uniref:uncharacterized protein isoform X2 n=1 Tax=Palaemon carinicauda TaxID=392227 RepID=UPI0035B6219A